MQLLNYIDIDILISTVLALIMFGVGLSLTIKDFEKVFTQPKALLLGLSLQMLALPVLTFLLVSVANLPAELKVGLVILSACPGGTTSNFLTYFWNGNTALSISLTTLNSLITLISIPVIVNFGLYFFMHTDSDVSLPFLQTMLQIFLITLLPASLGLLTRRLLPHFSKITEKPIKYTTSVLLALAFSIMFLADESQGGTAITQAEIVAILPFALIVNLSGLLGGYYIAQKLGMERKNQLTIGIEVGMQNTTLAFLVAGTLLANEQMMKPALVYAMFTFWTSFVFGYVVNRFVVKKSLGVDNL